MVGCRYICAWIHVSILPQVHTKTTGSTADTIRLFNRCIISSIVRLYYSVLLLNTPNSPDTPFTDNTSLVVVWSYIEECTSLVAACLPTLAPLLKNGRGLSTRLHRLKSLVSVRGSSQKNLRSGRTEGTSINNPGYMSVRWPWQKLHSGDGHTTKIGRGSDVALTNIDG